MVHIVTSSFQSSYKLYNHRPFERRERILRALGDSAKEISRVKEIKPLEEDIHLSRMVHSDMLYLFESGFREASGYSERMIEDCHADTGAGGFVPPMCAPKNRVHCSSRNLLSAMTCFGQDRFTPIYKDLSPSLGNDYAAVCKGVETLLEGPKKEVYVLPANPGHHASRKSYGGFCYLNWAVIAADLIGRLDESFGLIGILDIDFHCGNGTMAMVEDFPGLAMASIHMTTSLGEYPYSCLDKGLPGASVMGYPMEPGVDREGYLKILEEALCYLIGVCKVEALVISLGYGILGSDPEVVFPTNLLPEDFGAIGEMIRAESKDLPLLFVQEGGCDLEGVEKACQFLFPRE